MVSLQNKPSTLSRDDADLVRVAALELAMKAPTLVRMNPYYALGALSLALAQVAVLCRVSYQELQKLVSDHLESVLLAEVADELHQAGDPDLMLPKPQGEPEQ